MPDDKRRGVDPDLDPDLIREARAAGVRVIGRSADEIRAAIPLARQWREENAAAIDSWNDWVEKNGLPLEKHRPF
ncbi:MAG: type II toxin-antitoxin system CcdA family antitoxin [Minwuia sp.]|uniref:type II toxin-antitoxin system CcdA family antitoxin n=1 Tax=Minwuia sp. TaxID=2493630 RepID=UPI003A886A5C